MGVQRQGMEAITVNVSLIYRSDDKGPERCNYIYYHKGGSHLAECQSAAFESYERGLIIRIST